MSRAPLNPPAEPWCLLATELDTHLTPSLFTLVPPPSPPLPHTLPTHSSRSQQPPPPPSSLSLLNPSIAHTSFIPNLPLTTSSPLSPHLPYTSSSSRLLPLSPKPPLLTPIPSPSPHPDIPDLLTPPQAGLTLSLVIFTMRA